VGLLASCLSIGLTGCLHTQAKVLDPNTTVSPLLPRGTNFMTPSAGYFVPESTMLRLLDRLSEREVFGK
jgi:hypothetical protein